jgi:hypothetical protein
MELEVGELTGAAYGEKSAERAAQRHGDGDRLWETRAGWKRRSIGANFSLGVSGG